MYIVYGIKNCNTVQKTINWLNAHNIQYEFHDYKKAGISLDKLKEWEAQFDWETLLNKKGTTWRQLPDEVKSSITTTPAANKLMQEKTSVIKRPIIEINNKIVAIGFDENNIQKLL